MIDHPAITCLAEIFGTAQVEAMTSTAAVLNIPSGIQKDLAQQAIENVDLEPILRDIGAIVAREIADTLETMAMRPADYVDLPQMPQMVAAKLGGELAQSPEVFVKALLETLRMRG